MSTKRIGGMSGQRELVVNKVNIPPPGPLHDYDRHHDATANLINSRSIDKITTQPPQQQPVLPLLNHNNRKSDNNSFKWDDEDFANLLGCVVELLFKNLL